MATLTRPRMRSHPLRQRSFRRFLIGHLVSLTGDQLYFLALPWAAIQRGASGSVVGLLLAAAAVPRTVLMLAGGVLADRFGSRRVMLVSDALRAAGMVVAALVAFAGIGGVPGLFVLGFSLGAVDAFFQPALGGLIPRLVARDVLPAANALRTLAVRTSQLIGPALGGVMVAAGSVGWVFLIDATTFAVSFVALRGVVIPEDDVSSVDVSGKALGPARRSRQAGASGGTARRDLADGLRYVARTPVLAALLLFSAFSTVGFVGPTNVGLPLLARHSGWGASGLGLLFGALGAGAVIAAALLGLGRFPKAGSGALLLLAATGQAVCTLLTAFSGGLVLTVAVQVGLGFSATVAGVCAFGLLQAMTERPMLGRVTSLMLLAITGLTPLAYAGSGALVAWAGPAPLFIVGGLIQLAAVAIACSSRRLRAAGV